MFYLKENRAFYLSVVLYVLHGLSPKWNGGTPPSDACPWQALHSGDKKQMSWKGQMCLCKEISNEIFFKLCQMPC